MTTPAPTHARPKQYYSGLQRTLDPRYKTNLAIIILTVVGGIAAGIIGLLDDLSLFESAKLGFFAGAAIMLSWSLAREIDPDHEIGAFVAPVLAFVGTLLFGGLGLGGILGVFMLIQDSRLLARTTGLKAFPVDGLGAIAVGAAAAILVNWLFGVALALFLLFDALLPDANRRMLPFAGLALVFAAIGFYIKGRDGTADFASLPEWIAMIVIALLFAGIVVRGSRVITSQGDETGVPLNPRRVQIAQLLVVATVLLTAGWDGPEGALRLLPVWATLLGATIWRWPQLVRR